MSEQQELAPKGGKENTMGLHVFTDDADTVIATDLVDAGVVWSEHTGGDPEDHEAEWEQLPPEKEIAIWCDGNGVICEPHGDGSDLVTKTAAQWIAAQGRGFLCTTEY